MSAPPKLFERLTGKRPSMKARKIFTDDEMGRLLPTAKA
jgi:hypothetical protein